MSRPTFRCPNCTHKVLIKDETCLTTNPVTRCPVCNKRSRVSEWTTTEDSPASQGSELSVQPGPPETIGRFKILQTIGQGGFGTVYRAYDPQLEREVAVKVPRVGTLNSPKRVERFLGDARAAAQLRHPHIVPVFDVGQTAEGTYFIASAYVQGQTLADTLAASPTAGPARGQSVAPKPLKLQRAAKIIRQLAEALAYAHAREIVHRDVKPENILLDAGDEPHLIDFGLAHRGQDEQGENLVFGTPTYMSPEQASGRSGQGRAAMDQYSLGVTLYELITGRPPFQGDLKVLLYHHVHKEPKPPSELNEEIPADLEAICLKTLAKNPGDRYRNCAELAEDLRRWLNGEPVSVRKPPLSERFRRWAWREPVLAGAMALATVCLLLTAGVMAISAWRLSISEGVQRNARLAADESARQAREAESGERTARNEAEQAAERERNLKQLSLRDQYFDLIARSEREFRDGQARQARPLLDRATKLGLKPGWEWTYLDRQVREFRRPEPRPWTLAYRPNPDGKDQWLAWANENNVILRRCVASAGDDVLRIASGNRTDPVSCLSFSPDGYLLGIGFTSGAVALYQSLDGRTFGKEVLRQTGESRVTAISVSNLSRVAWGCANGTVGYFADLGEKAILRHNLHAGELRTVLLSPSGMWLATCCSAAVLKLTDLETNTLVTGRPLESITSGAFVLDASSPTVLRSNSPPTPTVVVRPDPMPVPRPPPSGAIDRRTELPLWSGSPIRWVPGNRGDPQVAAVFPYVLLGCGALMLVIPAAPIMLGAGGLQIGITTLVQPSLPPSALVRALQGFKARVLAKEGGTLVVFDLLNAERAQYAEHTSDVIAVRSSVENDCIASLDDSGVFKVWRIRGRATQNLHSSRTAGGFALSSDGNLAAWMDGEGVIVHRDLATGASLSFNRETGENANDDQSSKTLAGHTGSTHGVAYGKSGEFLFSGEVQGSRQKDAVVGEIRCWNTANGEHRDTVRTNGPTLDASTRHLAYFGEGDRLLLASVAALADATPLPNWAPGPTRVLRFNPEGSRLAATAVGNRVLVWNTAWKSVTSTFEVGAPVVSLAWGKDLVLYTGDDRGRIVSWQEGAQSGRPFATRDRAVNTLAISPDAEGQYLVAGGDEGSIQVWNRKDGKEVFVIRPAHSNGVLGLAFAPDGARLASVGRDRTIRLWEVGTWREALALPSRVGLRPGLAFHPHDGRELAIATVEGVRVFQAVPQR